MQTKIIKLPPDIIAKIAAGEVIERPAYAVKEVIENAIDAKATRIVIHIEEAGLKTITVIDNGIGMNKDNLIESFKLHTTSKLQTIDELSHIGTLGFRGEALASIAAISILHIQSRYKKSISGSFIEVQDGKMIDSGTIGMPEGTRVTVSRLFHSVPARKKFLKSQQTEFRQILDIVSRIVLSHPEIAFVLTHNKKIILDLPQTEKLQDRLHILLGSKNTVNLLPLGHQDSYLTIEGFIGAPSEMTFGTTKQFLFVNGRAVSDKFLASLIKDAYGNMLTSKSQPVFALSLSLPFEHVDVNVHPRKERIRFADTNHLAEFVQKAVTKTLAESNVSFYDQKPFGIALGDAEVTKSYTGRFLKENTIPWDIRVRDEINGSEEIMQLHNLYLLKQTKFGIVLIDQHAAHERILFEQLSNVFRKKQQNQPQYSFTKPVILELSLTDSELLFEHLSLFETLGFNIEHFKDTAFLLHQVPLLLQDRKPKELLLELLADLANEKKTKTIDTLSHKIISFLACRSAIKAGESLSKKQAKDLIEKLDKTENNSTCPHGRPTKIIIDINQLHRMFKRK